MTVLSTDIVLRRGVSGAYEVLHKGINVGELLPAAGGRWIAVDTRGRVRLAGDDARMAGALLAEGHGR
jgi:hypothetical protein